VWGGTWANLSMQNVNCTAEWKQDAVWSGNLGKCVCKLFETM